MMRSPAPDPKPIDTAVHIYPPKMTVGQLRRALEQYSDDMIVLTAGCDCWGDVGSVDTEEHVALEPNGEPQTIVLLDRTGEGMYG